MRLRQLKYFLAVVDNKSFTKAARVLGVAQPAIGLQIRKLEEEFNVPLLVRHSRGVETTEAGNLLLDYARTALEHMDAATTALKNFVPTVGGRVVVGMAPSISAMLAPSLLRRATAELPNVSLALVDELSSVLMEWLLAHRLDIAIGYEMLQSANISGDPLLVEEIFLVQSAKARPRLGNTVAFSQLSKFDLLLPSSTHGLRDIAERHARERSIHLTIRCEVQSIHLIKELIGQNIGATLLPYGAVRHECEQGRLVAAKVVDPEINRTAYLAYAARRRPSNAETAILRLIRDVAKTEAGPNTALWRSIEAVTPNRLPDTPNAPRPRRAAERPKGSARIKSPKK